MNEMQIFFYGVYDPVAAAGTWIYLPAALWLAVLLVHAVPRAIAEIVGLWRANGAPATVFVLAVTVLAIYAFPTKAEKGGGTNEPPVIPPAAVPSAVINLYHEGPDGRLYPIGVPIQEVAP